MIRALLSALILLWAVDAHAIIVIGGTGAAPEAPPATCETQSADVSLTVNNASSTFYTSNERGQSWQAGATGVLYSVTFHKNTTGTDTLTIRIGTSADLSTSYMVQFTCSAPSAAGDFECVIAEGNRPSLTSGTTYHLLSRVTNGGWDLARDSAGGYADGTAYFDVNKNWIGTTAVSDLYFIATMCD